MVISLVLSSRARDFAMNVTLQFLGLLKANFLIRMKKIVKELKPSRLIRLL
jgi:hypothetical protein